jgi:hypothetical protein
MGSTYTYFHLADLLAVAKYSVDSRLFSFNVVRFFPFLRTELLTVEENVLSKKLEMFNNLPLLKRTNFQ